MKKKVTVFTGDNCINCKVLKKELSKHNIEFDVCEHNKHTEPIFKEFDIVTVPTTLIFEDGKIIKTILGLYDVKELKEVL